MADQNHPPIPETTNVAKAIGVTLGALIGATIGVAITVGALYLSLNVIGDFDLAFRDILGLSVLWAYLSIVRNAQSNRA